MSSLNRREFLAGAGAVASSLAMGRGVGDFADKLSYISKEAVLNNVPLCLVGNLEVNKMETVVCNNACSTAGDVANWINTLGFNGRCVLVCKHWNDTTYRTCAVITVNTSGQFFNAIVTQGGLGVGFDIRTIETHTLTIPAGTEFYVLRPAQ